MLGDADRRRDVEGRQARRRDRLGRQGQTHALGDGRSLVQMGLDQDDQEFLPAVTEDEVAGADVLGHGLGHLAQHLVADRMAVRVIDPLEVVDVQQQHRQRRVVGVGEADLTAQDR
ncbi:hypothetical protein D3C73_1058820 [compost metagenome]